MCASTVRVTDNAVRDQHGSAKKEIKLPNTVGMSFGLIAP